MGKIYSWERIENGNIPTPDQFSCAKRFVLDELLKFVPEDIYGAKVFGSVAKNSPSNRSDFDLLVLINNEGVFGELNNLVQEIKKETEVEVEPLVLTIDQAKQGLHTIDPNFYRHFQKIPNEGNLVGSDPLNMVQPFSESQEKFLIDYLRQKLRRFNQGGFDSSETEELNLIQRVLESPIAIGRKVISLLREKNKFEWDEDDDGKKSVIRNYKRLMDGLEIDTSDFDQIVSIDQKYNVFLKESLEQKHDRREYRQFLDDIKTESLPLARNWTMKTGVWLKDQFNSPTK